MQPHIAGLILAGGQATRMGGGDKGLLPLGGMSVIQHVFDRFSGQVESLALSANGDPQRFSSFGLPVLPDPPIPPCGPLGGILAGMRWAERLPDAPAYIATVAADTPFLPEDLVERLAAEREAAPIVLAASKGRCHPVFGLWPVSLARSLEHFLESSERKSVRAFAGGHISAATVAFDEEDGRDPFFNINTPAQLLAARDALRDDER